MDIVIGIASGEPSQVFAFWKAIGERPDDQLPRLVFADWLDEREVTVECECITGWTTRSKAGYAYASESPRLLPDFATVGCPSCGGERDSRGTGYVSNGYADLAAALRATASRVPFTSVPQAGERAGVRYWSWICEGPVEYADTVPPDILDALSGKIVDGHTNWRDYPTAEAAIRDLCSAWIKVHRKEVPA